MNYTFNRQYQQHESEHRLFAVICVGKCWQLILVSDSTEERSPWQKREKSSTSKCHKNSVEAVNWEKAKKTLMATHINCPLKKLKIIGKTTTVRTVNSSQQEVRQLYCENESRVTYKQDERFVTSALA